MRSAVLLACAVLLGVCIFVRGWAGADLSGGDYDGTTIHHVEAHVEIGLRSARDCDQGDCRIRGLRDFDKIDRDGEVEGALASYALGLAALALLVAAWLVRGGPVIGGIRVAVAAACALALLAALVFVVRLSHVSWSHLGWAAYAAIAASMVGAMTILVERPKP